MNAGRAVLNEHFGQPFWDGKGVTKRGSNFGRNGTKQAASIFAVEFLRDLHAFHYEYWDFGGEEVTHRNYGHIQSKDLVIHLQRLT